MQWSSRIHVLERDAASEDIRITNRYPCYAAYNGSRRLQYLYEPHRTRVDGDSNHRRASIFRTVDRIRLTSSIIREELDMTGMETKQIVVSFFALHSASKYDLVNIESLYDKWITFWSPFLLQGEPRSHSCLIKYMRRIYPFRQPITDIRDYFGEKISLYFVWIGFYAQLQLIPAIAALCVLLTQNSDSKMSTNTVIVLMCIIVAWSLLFVKLWARRSHMAKLAWGVCDLDDIEKPRLNEKKQWNFIATRMDKHFFSNRKLVYQFQKLLLLSLISIAPFARAWCIFLIQDVIVRYLGSDIGAVMASFLQVIGINFHSIFIWQVCTTSDASIFTYLFFAVDMFFD